MVLPRNSTNEQIIPILNKFRAQTKKKILQNCFYEVNIICSPNLKDCIQNRITDRSHFPEQYCKKNVSKCSALEKSAHHIQGEFPPWVHKWCTIKPVLSSFFSLLPSFLFFPPQSFLEPRLVLTLLNRPGWFCTLDPPASAFQVLRFQA